VLKAVDLKNIQDDINTTGLADADSIQGVPVVAPTPADDGKAFIYDDGVPEFTYGSLSGLPSGIYLPYGGAAAPAGWQLCYGQAVSRATFADLFTAIGTGYGVGDGSTTFNLPDMRGRNALGKDDMGGASADVVTDAAADSIGGTLGVEDVTLTSAQSGVPAHTHPQDPTTLREAAGAIKGGTAFGTTGGTTQANTPADAVSSHTNMNPQLTSNWIIKN
jgi:microcystin-dependent protein